MLPLTTPLLAALLGQACPTPSPYDPPPCAAAKVPGCLPGYRPQYDRSGRLFYVCNNVQPRAAFQSPPPSLQPASQASLTPTAPPELAATPPPPPSDRGHVGLVFMPGVSSFPTYHGFGGTKAEGQIALEFRGSGGGGGGRPLGGKNWEGGGVGERVNFGGRRRHKKKK